MTESRFVVTKPGAKPRTFRRVSRSMHKLAADAHAERAKLDPDYKETSIYKLTYGLVPELIIRPGAQG